MAALTLFGITTTLTYVYFRKYASDPWPMRVFVATLWSLECAHSVISSRILYLTTIDNPGNISSFNPTSPIFSWNGLVSEIITCSVQMYFIFRLFKITSVKDLVKLRSIISALAPIICVAMTVTRFLIFLIYISRQLVSPSIANLKNRTLFVTGLISVGTDILISVSLAYCLWRRLRKEMIPKKGMINQVIIWSLETDILTCITTISTIILFYTTHGLIGLAMTFIACRLFSISFLTCTIACRNLREKGDPIPTSFPVLFQESVGAGIPEISPV